jgi:cation diffusion facilitator family transporter
METEIAVSDREPRTAVAAVRRVTWAGMFINLALAGLKMLAGTLGHSQAVVADAVHSLSDCGTDIALLVGAQYWSLPPDDEHPYGHGRIETIVTLIIGGALATAALGLAYSALMTLPHSEEPPPGQIAFWAAIVSIIVKEGLYRWTMRVGRRVRSSALMANAWHHRSDAFSSVPVALAVAVAWRYPSWVFVDHVATVVVALLILQVAWKVAWPSLKQLADTGAPLREHNRIRAVALKTPGVREVHAIRTRYAGSSLQVDLHVLVDGGMTVREGHDVAETVSRQLIEERRDVIDVLVHLEPYDEGGGSP